MLANVRTRWRLSSAASSSSSSTPIPASSSSPLSPRELRGDVRSEAFSAVATTCCDNDTAARIAVDDPWKPLASSHDASMGSTSISGRLVSASMSSKTCRT